MSDSHIHTHLYELCIRTCLVVETGRSLFLVASVCYLLFFFFWNMNCVWVFSMLLLLLSPSCFFYHHKLNGTNVDSKHVTVPLLYIYFSFYVFCSIHVFFFLQLLLLLKLYAFLLVFVYIQSLYIIILRILFYKLSF